MLILNLKPAEWFTLKMKVRRDTRCKVSKERKSKRWTKSTQASKLNIKERNVLEFLKVSDSCYQTFAVVLLLPGNPNFEEKKGRSVFVQVNLSSSTNVKQ